VYVSDAEATQVLGACRSKLTQIVLNKDATGSNFDRDNRKPADAFIRDLKGLGAARVTALRRGGARP